MGLIVTTFMMSLGTDFILPAIIGNIGAIIGSIVSVRFMLYFTKKYYNITKIDQSDTINKTEITQYREIREGNLFQRVLDALLEGGK